MNKENEKKKNLISSFIVDEKNEKNENLPPFDILLEIFSFFNLNEILKFSTLNWFFYKFCSTNFFWKKFLKLKSIKNKKMKQNEKLLMDKTGFYYEIVANNIKNDDYEGEEQIFFETENLNFDDLKKNYLQNGIYKKINQIQEQSKQEKEENSILNEKKNEKKFFFMDDKIKIEEEDDNFKKRKRSNQENEEKIKIKEKIKYFEDYSLTIKQK
jgi:hypothetical protein